MNEFALKFFSIIITYKLIINIFYYLKLKRIFTLYKAWLKDKNWELLEKKHELKDLFKRSNIIDSSVPYVQPAGYNLIAKSTTSVIENFPSNRRDIANITYSMCKLSLWPVSTF